MAPTGVSAKNIGGTTVNTALAIPKETGENLPAMSDQKKTQMRVSLSHCQKFRTHAATRANLKTDRDAQVYRDLYGHSRKMANISF